MLECLLLVVYYALSDTVGANTQSYTSESEPTLGNLFWKMLKHRKICCLRTFYSQGGGGTHYEFEVQTAYFINFINQFLVVPFSIYKPPPQSTFSHPASPENNYPLPVAWLHQILWESV